jgi:hypothetical protein
MEQQAKGYAYCEDEKELNEHGSKWQDASHQSSAKRNIQQ